MVLAQARGLIRRGGLGIPRKVYGDQEAIRPIIRELVAVSFEGFMLVLPHAEAVVGLRRPVLQVVHHNFVAGIIALHALKDYFALAVVHLGVSYAGLGVHVPGKCGSIPGLFLPGNRRIDLGENVTESGLLLLADGGIEIHYEPGVLAGAPVAA